MLITPFVLSIVMIFKMSRHTIRVNLKFSTYNQQNIFFRGESENANYIKKYLRLH